MQRRPRTRRPDADVGGEGKVSISDICSELAGGNIGGVDGTGETAHHCAACSDTADDIQSVSRGGCADADVAGGVNGHFDGWRRAVPKLQSAGSSLAK